MNYKLAPTDSDVLHYAKGSESKSHNYISRVFQKGRWVYTYAKNRARGNKVTNKTKGTTPYSPKIVTSKHTDIYSTKDGYNGHTKDVTNYFNDKKSSASRERDSVTNQGSPDKQYNPTVKTLDIGRDMGGRLTNVFNGHNISKAMAENMTAETKTDGLTYFANIMNAARTETVTNRTKDVKQYTPNYKESTTTNQSKKATSQYSPDIRTNRSAHPAYQEPLSYTQTSADPTKHDWLIRRDLGQKDLAKQIAEKRKKKK